ncbi:unnamed protein product [Sphagnum tenellum]
MKAGRCENCRNRARGSALVLGVVVQLMVQSLVAYTSLAATPPVCSYEGVYAFGDSLTDVGNGIASFPNQFIRSESVPYGLQFPHHAADRFCDGRLLVDFLAFGVGLSPIYAYLRGFAADFSNGVNFAASGATARSITTWDATAKFNSPFTLSTQLQWLQRYRVRLEFYYTQTRVTQVLPTVASLNSSLYLVYAGFHDYMSGFYDNTLTPAEAQAIVPSVVAPIISAVQAIYEFGGRDILVVNLPPLGCIPALLTLHPADPSLANSYDDYGCLKRFNKPIKAHNSLLRSSLNTLRTTYPDANLYYGDLHGVFINILKNSSDQGISNPLQACCGFGGSYNFNTDVTCGSTGSVDGVEVDLTVSCFNPESYGSWDGIHLSQIINRAAATAFLNGKYIEPNGGMHCTPDTSNWYTHNLSMLVPTLSGCQEDSSKVQRVQSLNHFPPWQLVRITHLFPSYPSSLPYWTAFWL